MDRYAARIANILCGNEENAAVLELVLHGARLCTDAPHLMAFTGAGAKVCIDDVELPLYRPVLVPAGAMIDLRYADSGCRIYMALAGGIETPEIMGSKSFASVLSMPALSAGAMLSTGSISPIAKKIMASLHGVASWGAQPSTKDNTVRCVAGMEWDWLNETSKAIFINDPFIVSNRSNRMGYMLTGSVLQTKENAQLISTGVMPGTIQLTPNGSLIVLMADAQTTGGYPRVAQVIEADLSIVAQCRPESKIHFKLVSMEEGITAYRAMNQYLHDLQQTIKLNFS